MSAGSTQQTWTEPPWSGWIETTGDALLILEAARRGLIPRVTRRLVDSERKMITSGSVFVFDEDESGIKRWTDGYFWSPSRILGNFLLYRETDKRGPGHRLSNGSDSNDDTHQSQVLSRPKSDSLSVNKQRERSLMGSLTNSYKFKPDGLMKKTFSLTIGGVAQHLISYYKVEDVENGRLRSPSSLPELASLDISPDYLDKTHFRNPPKVEVGPDGIPRYRGEADDIDTSAASSLSAPLSSGLPLLTEGRVMENPKRAKRFDPCPADNPPPKRHRKETKKPSPEGESQSEPPAAASYSETSTTRVTAPQPPYPPYAAVRTFYPTYPVPPHVYAYNAQAQQGTAATPYPWPYAQPIPHSTDSTQAHSQPTYYAYPPYPHPYAGWPPYGYMPAQAVVTQPPANIDKSSTSAAESDEQSASPDGDR